MSNIVRIRRTSTPEHKPAPNDLESAELAVNLADGRLFTADTSGHVVDLTGVKEGDSPVLDGRRFHNQVFTARTQSLATAPNAIITGLNNELTNWDNRGGTLTVTADEGITYSNEDRLMRASQIGGSIGRGIAARAPGNISFEFAGRFNSFGSGSERRAYAQLRNQTNANRFTPLLVDHNDSTDGWKTLVGGTHPGFINGVWVSPYRIGSDPQTALRFTFSLTETSTIYLIELGWTHPNISYGQYAFPLLESSSTFYGNNYTFRNNVNVEGRLTAPDYSSADWDTAYAWGNHADAGYGKVLDTGWVSVQRTGWHRIAEATGAAGSNFTLHWQVTGGLYGVMELAVTKYSR